MSVLIRSGIIQKALGTRNTMDEYNREMERLRSLGRDWNFSNEEVDKIIEDSIDYFIKEKHKSAKINTLRSVNIRRILACGVFLIILLTTLFVYRKTVQNIVERNVQEIIYPGMKLFRKLMLPIIEAFPSLTEWYDENCLVRNPYFQVSDIDCWPCSNVRSVLNVTGNDISTDHYHSGIPFIYKENHIKYVDFKELQETYMNSKEMFDQHSPRVEISGSGTWQTIEEVLFSSSILVKPSHKRDSHFTWKLSRLEPIRAARHLFGFPQKIPYYVAGAVPEKFILIDEPRSSPFMLPVTEGSTVFIIQGSGSRLLVLDPVPGCKTECHRVSLVLQPHHILWYNWWYWRASSFPLLGNEEISITYIGSYY